jgi:hypothetical protein
MRKPRLFRVDWSYQVNPKKIVVCIFDHLYFSLMNALLILLSTDYLLNTKYKQANQTN